jgi:hypothetical protein
MTDAERQKLCAYLREQAGHEYDAAADEIERLAKEVAELRQRITGLADPVQDERNDN